MFSIGTKVKKRLKPGAIGTIVSLGAVFNGEQTYEVDFGYVREFYTEGSLVEFNGKASVIDNLMKSSFSEYTEYQKALTFLKLYHSNIIQNNLYSINTSRTEFYEYQFKPLMKFINSFKRRLLICDEVGLGKTIETGLILKELEARNELHSALIVVPANLKYKWVTEMKIRFCLDFNVIATQKEFLNILTGDKGSFSKYANKLFIVSLESIRGRKSLAQIEESETKWDILIVDEAHSLRNQNQQHKTIKVLSENAEAIVFLTATPMHLAQDNLYNILNILDEQQFGHYHSFERQLKENKPIVDALNRISRLPPDVTGAWKCINGMDSKLSSNPIYMELNALLYSLVSNTNVNPQNQTCDSKAIDLDNKVSMEDIVSVQRMLSELHYLGSIYNRTKKKDVQNNRTVRESSTVVCEFNAVEMDIYNSIIKAVRDDIDASDGSIGMLRLCGVKRMLSSSLHAHGPLIYEKYQYENLGIDSEDSFILEREDDLNESEANINNSIIKVTDSKLDILVQTLQKVKTVSNKVIIFGFYKTTLSYLRGCLDRMGYQCRMITGTSDIEGRRREIDEFKNCEEFCILLSSRVGSEGIDLQFCDTIINYDLPWNPMELEQRIGRIDRIGQKSPTIHIFNLSMLSTIDDVIVTRLYERIQLFEGTIGLLEPIMGEIVRELTNELFVKELSPQELQLKLLEQEKVLENKTRDLKELEEKNNELLSLDLFYENEIKTIRKNRRFITPGQLYQYINGMIASNYVDSRISYNFESQIGEILICKSFRRELRLLLPDERRLDRFSYGHPVKFTMDSSKAMEDSNLEFVNILHPLVSGITTHYLNMGIIHNCHKFDLSSKELENNGVSLKTGYYFFFIFLGTVKSSKEVSIITPVVLDESLNEIGSSELCEQVIGIALESGETMYVGLEISNEEYLRKAHDKAFSIFRGYFEKYFKHFESRHKIMLQRRRDNKQYGYERKRNSVMLTLETMKTFGDREKIKPVIRMNETMLANLDAKYLSDLDDIEHEQYCEPSYEAPRYGGVFRVY